MSGLFVSFEGGEGSGKTTQCALLAERLSADGHHVVQIREPGGTDLGESVRSLLLHPQAPLTSEAELLLFLAARAQLTSTVIRPSLEAGAIVICDRFSDSTLAYQGYGRGLDLGSIRQADHLATSGLAPHLTVLLDLPIDHGRRRKDADEDAFQREEDAFHERVRQGYLALAREDPARWLVLDATQPIAPLAQAVFNRLGEVLSRPEPPDGLEP